MCPDDRPPPETSEARAKRLIPEKRYVGDSVYVESVGYGIAVWLTTSNGVEDTNRIMLESEVWEALQTYMTELDVGVRALITEKEEEEKTDA